MVGIELGHGQDDEAPATGVGGRVLAEARKRGSSRESGPGRGRRLSHRRHDLHRAAARVTDAQSTGVIEILRESITAVIA